MASATAIARTCVLAPAKLNLHLELLHRRKDGYHDLETVMVAINLCDNVSIELREDQVSTFRCHWQPNPVGYRSRLGQAAQDGAFRLPPHENNLAWKAVERFRQATGFEQGVDIDIGKRIPMGAGLGGASADAAGILAALAHITERDPCDEILMEIAAGLGSDVPFMLAAAAGQMSACIARGRGEVLERLDIRKDLHFVVLYPPHPLSTREVYAHSQVPIEPVSSKSVVASLTGAEDLPLSGLTHNRLQPPACALEPRVAQCIEALKRAGAVAAAVTGSGAACYGICHTAAQARRMARQLSGRAMGIAFAVQPNLTRNITQDFAT